MWLLVVLALVLALMVWRDPRQLKIGVVLLCLVWLALGFGLSEATLALRRWDALLVDHFLIMLLVTILGAVVVLGVALVLNGVTMWRREGRRLANLLSLLLGLAILGYFGLGVGCLVVDWRWAVSSLVIAGLAIGYLAFGFIAYLLYSWLYLIFARRLARPGAAVVVLGAGLINGRASPLLARRLDRGQAVWRRAIGAGQDPALVVSGGQGPDEPRAEAWVMADYLDDHGVDRALVLLEDRSRSTEQNLRYSQELLTTRGLSGRMTVVTSDFHAFRAAMLMRRLKIAGQAVGAPTAAYYWPSAVIREYAAILRDHWVFNLVALLVLQVPSLLWLILQG
ncbi:MAG: YdcF family protein [Propionibacteriaceae bacterium]|jgi:uncharacterized SAM-binding protein YcdF (DUF218 family)|nr:YdcF family protein [Propionibacteriaceae bacterium]